MIKYIYIRCEKNSKILFKKFCNPKNYLQIAPQLNS